MFHAATWVFFWHECHHCCVVFLRQICCPLGFYSSRTFCQPFHLWNPGILFSFIGNEITTYSCRVTVKPSQAYPPKFHSIAIYYSKVESVGSCRFQRIHLYILAWVMSPLIHTQFIYEISTSSVSLNLTPVTGTTNGFIFQIINSLIESCGVCLTCFDCKKVKSSNMPYYHTLYSLSVFVIG